MSEIEALDDGEDRFAMFYHEDESAAQTPEEVLRNLERLCGTLSDEFVKAFWQRVDEYAKERIARGEDPTV